MDRDIANDRLTLNAILTMAQNGDRSTAIELAEKSLATGLEHPLTFNLVALALEQREQIGEAERLLRRAVYLFPDDTSLRNALGLCLMRMERPADALVQFDALLKLNPSLPFAHTNLGRAFASLGLASDAEASYHRAIALDSKQGMAFAGLAYLSNKRGSYEVAREWAEKALRLLPGLPDATMSLCAAELGEKRVASAEHRVRALLEDTRLEPREKAYASGLLGDVLDAKNYTAEAFAAYEACNDELRVFYSARYVGGENALVYVNDVIQFFENMRAENWPTVVSSDARTTGAAGHVFVLGFLRSGTTLLEVILEGHPDVVSLEENELLIDAVNEFMRQPGDLDRLVSASPTVLHRLRAAYWRHVAASGADVSGKWFVDKNPLNSLKLPLIARLFPDAKILLACRDPRDVVLSCFRHRFEMSAPIFELLSVAGAARYYDAVMRLIVRLSSMLPLKICLVRHEDVVTEFGREMKRICAFLDLEWHAGMGDFAARTKKRESLTPSTAQLAKGLNTEGVGQWRRYSAHLAPVFGVLAPWIKRFYYD